MSKAVLQTVAHLLAERQPELGCPIGDSPWHYQGKKSTATKLNITLRQVASSDDRLAFAGWLFGRAIASTKELTVAEALAVRRTEALLPQLYEAFQSERIPETGS